MAERMRKDFCINCRKETEYLLRKGSITKRIRDKDYMFNITVAVCSECGEEMSLPGLIDRNVQEIDDQYRAYEGLVTKDDIENLMSNPISGRSGSVKRLFAYYKDLPYVTCTDEKPFKAL